ncbi:MAG: hypothetical protein WEA08_04675, partial [Woeseia sp.]
MSKRRGNDARARCRKPTAGRTNPAARRIDGPLSAICEANHAAFLAHQDNSLSISDKSQLQPTKQDIQVTRIDRNKGFT